MKSKNNRIGTLVIFLGLLFVGGVSTGFLVNPVAAAPDFVMSSSNLGLSVVVGSGTATSTINISSLNGFNGTISLSASPSGPGIQANLNPTSVSLVSGGSAISQLNVTASTAGSYTVSVTGTSTLPTGAVIAHVITFSVTASLPATSGGPPPASSPGTIPPYVGRICLVPGVSNACPQTLPSLTTDPTGHLIVSVNILGSASFNATSIMLHWDAAVVNVTTFDLTNTILPSPSILANCANSGGTGCGSHDGIGVVHFDLLGGNSPMPSSGNLMRLSFVGSPVADAHIRFQTGCSTVSIGVTSSTGSVPNTDLCLVVGQITTTICTTFCTETLTADPESVQSQSLGVHLPTALSTVSPPGNITGTLGPDAGPPNFAETWVLPYQISLPGNITAWKAQFTNGLVSSSIPYPPTPIGVQLSVLRKTSTNILSVVELGPIHDPRPVLASRLPSWPYVLTEETVIPYYTDTLLTVQPGDYIGLTFMANSTIGGYEYPLINATGGARGVMRSVAIGGTIDLSDSFTSILPGQSPAIDLTIQPSPSTLSTAGDGIPDFVKLSPEMRALGADPCRKTILVQLDYMQPTQGALTFRPLQPALDIVTNSFDNAPVPTVTPCPYQGFPLKASGIKLVLDVKNAIPEQDVFGFTNSAPMSFDTVKATYFDPSRLHYFHYGLFVNQTLSGRGPSGIGETFGSNFIVSLGNWTNKVGSVYEQAGTLMHELGHNLGLGHGGGDSINRKPNYLSVMSYEHQVIGIVTKTPTGNVTRFDYSREVMPTLDESNLNGFTILSNSNDYTAWVCPDHHTVKRALVSNPLDWACTGTISTGVANDVNNDTLTSTLNGYNDWLNLRYNFVQSDNFNVGCRINCDIGCRINCDIGCRINCDIGCRIGCDIGCRSECEFGDELDRPTAVAIETSWHQFFSTPHRSTLTSLTCTPGSVIVNNPSTCTATVNDIDSGTAITPTGTVSFQSSKTGTFSPTTCNLASTSGTATCSVNYSPGLTSSGSQTITAGYGGDTNHLGSSGTSTVNGIPFPVFTFSTNTTLTTDLTGRVVVSADNVTLNCNGHSITGITTDQFAGAYPGISLNNRKGVIVENCRIAKFYIGIQLVSSKWNLMLKNNVQSSGYGFVLSTSNFNALTFNNATYNLYDGFRLVSSNATALGGNRANNNLGSGFILVRSSTNGLAGNYANANGNYGFAFTSYSKNNLVQNNSACMNTIFDAYQDTTSTGNTYKNNLFCKTSGLGSGS